MFSRYLMGILAVGAVVQLGYYYPLLPDTMATHFDGLGAPDDWSSRQGFFAVYLGVIALNLLIFLPMPQLLARKARPGSRIARDPRALVQLQKMMGAFGVMNLALALYVAQLVLAANLAPPPRLPATIMYVLGVYFALVLAGIIWIAVSHRQSGSR